MASAVFEHLAAIGIPRDDGVQATRGVANLPQDGLAQGPVGVAIAVKFPAVSAESLGKPRGRLGSQSAGISRLVSDQRQAVKLPDFPWARKRGKFMPTMMAAPSGRVNAATSPGLHIERKRIT
jgi:hypothetical protein